MTDKNSIPSWTVVAVDCGTILFFTKIALPCLACLISATNSILPFYSLSLFSLLSPSPPCSLGHRESEQVLNMVLCVYIHKQVSAKMSACVDRLTTTTTTTTTTTCEPLTVFIMNNLAFCQLPLKSEPAGSLY